MPLYEYKCDSCGATFEVIQRFADPPIEVCRTCGGPVKKVLSAPAIQFKGTGWYVTDYAKKSSVDASKSSAPSSSSGDSAKSSDTSSSTPASSSSSDKKPSESRE